MCSRTSIVGVVVICTLLTCCCSSHDDLPVMTSISIPFNETNAIDEGSKNLEDSMANLMETSSNGSQPATGAHADLLYIDGMLVKSVWPELVGKSFDEAKQVISVEAPDVTLIQSVPADSFVTLDYLVHRVRVFMKDGKVASPPKRG